MRITGVKVDSRGAAELWRVSGATYAVVVNSFGVAVAVLDEISDGGISILTPADSTFRERATAIKLKHGLEFEVPTQSKVVK